MIIFHPDCLNSEAFSSKIGFQERLFFDTEPGIKCLTFELLA